MFRSSPEHVESWYAATSAHLQRPRPALTDSLQADVCIVGAGFFGLHCALELARAGRRVVVLEASRVGWGASGRNGGQMVPGFSCGMQNLKAAVGPALAQDLFDESQRAMAQLRGLVREHAIDCEWRDGHVEVAVLPRRVKLLTDWQDEWRREWGHDRLRFIGAEELPQWVNSPRYIAGLYDPDAAHVHPLKLVLGLAQLAEQAGVRIFEGSRVMGHRRTAHGVTVELAPAGDGQAAPSVQCQQLVLAANAYVDRVDRRLASRILPVGTFIGTTEVLGEALCRELIPGHHAVFDNQFILEYFRTTADHRLLFGGRCTYLGGEPANLPEAMKANIVRAFPRLKDVRVAYAWGGHIDITMRRMPDWGRRDDRVFWAQGFCGHGLVTTRVAATLVTEAMQGNTRRLDAMAGIVNPPFPGGETLGGLMQAVGMSWYRLRDWV